MLQNDWIKQTCKNNSRRNILQIKISTCQTSEKFCAEYMFIVLECYAPFIVRHLISLVISQNVNLLSTNNFLNLVINRAIH